MIMRSRSTRLFIVLLHMVGVSRNLPKITSSQLSWNVGIIGVLPQQIKSNVIDLSTITTDGIQQPFWLVDDTDGTCLGPLGKFSECGDATLWKLRRAPPSSPPPPSHNDTSEHYYSLEIFDVFLEDDLNDTQHNSQATTESIIRQMPYNDHAYFVDSLVGQQQQQLECLTMASSSSASNNNLRHHQQRQRRNKQQNKKSLTKTNNTTMSYQMKLDSCTSTTNNRDYSNSWRVDKTGLLCHVAPSESVLPEERSTNTNNVLHFFKAILHYVFVRNKQILTDNNNNNSSADELCVYRKSASNEAILASCQQDVMQHQVVTFSLITRYTPSSAATTVHHSKSLPASTITSDEQHRHEQHYDTSTTGLDALQMIASKHYYTGTSFPPTTTISSSSSPIGVPSCETTTTALDALQMIASKHYDTAAICDHQQQAHHPHYHPIIVTLNNNGQQQQQETSTLFRSATTTTTTTKIGSSHNKIHVDTPIRNLQNVGITHWKMPRHLYLESSNNGVWIDPQTRLTYRTDFCQYLGHTRKTAGRHTLVGVGQYTRTPLKIRVYGAALYVSKRDVLSDPSFAKYAHWTVEQLRNDVQFYELLMGTQTLVDRTLLVQLNMQMSTETIRSSLTASWTMLTEEMKSLLLNSSFQARQAEPSMLAKISSSDNPSRCSCGQLAPDSYNADPSCCRRGTELVFTWRKNGNLELRLDGRMIESFPRPDMARGIFYEYLRPDDPMSVDARDHFVDGFPFLLAPLAQVRGLTSATHHHPPHQKKPQPSTRTMTSWMGNVLSATGPSVILLSSGMGEINHQIAKAVDGAVKGVLGDWGQQQEKIGGEAMRFITQNVPFLSGQKLQTEQIANTPLLRGTTMMGRSYDDIVDENGVIEYPSMDFNHKLFSATVHIYLLLLLIVSLPGTGSTRMINKDRGGKDDTTVTSTTEHVVATAESQIILKNDPVEEMTPIKVTSLMSATVGQVAFSDEIMYY